MDFTQVGTTNTEETIRVLAEAFVDDPVMNWACNYPESLRGFFEITLPPFIPHGLSYLDVKSRGAAVWLGPDEKLNWPFTFANVVKVLQVGRFTGIHRMLRSGMATEKHHPKKPHYYLFAIGVVPQCKGQGVGSAMMRHVLKLCDEEGMPAYLENSKEANLPFYAGHGFKVLKQIRFASSAPPVWLMWREPLPVGK